MNCVLSKRIFSKKHAIHIKKSVFTRTPGLQRGLEKSNQLMTLKREKEGSKEKVQMGKEKEGYKVEQQWCQE